MDRGIVTRFCWAMLCLGLWAIWHPAIADVLMGKRVALVIGNAGYRYAPKLPSAANDARLMAQTLKSAGFALIGGGALVDLEHDKLAAAVQQFGDAAADAEVTLVYFAGHAVQVGGVNYLAPINAKPTRPGDLEFQLLGLDLVLRQVAGGGSKLNVVILEASHPNPLARAFGGMADGLADMPAPPNTLLLSAAQPGQFVPEGGGKDGALTLALVDAIRRPNVEVSDAVAMAVAAVKQASGGAQTPWSVHGALAGQFYVVGGQGAASGMLSGGIAKPTAPAAVAAAAPPAVAPPPAAAPAPLRQPLLHIEAAKPAAVPSAPPAPPPPPGFHCPPPGMASIVNDRRYDWIGPATNDRHICFARIEGRNVATLFGIFPPAVASPALEQTLDRFFRDFTGTAEVAFGGQKYTWRRIGADRLVIHGETTPVVLIEVETGGDGLLHLDHHVGTWTLAYDPVSGLFLKGDYLPKFGVRKLEPEDWATSMLLPPQ